jgi:hypothetical protein
VEEILGVFPSVFRPAIQPGDELQHGQRGKRSNRHCETRSNLDLDSRISGLAESGDVHHHGPIRWPGDHSAILLDASEWHEIDPGAMNAAYVNQPLCNAWCGFKRPCPN